MERKHLRADTAYHDRSRGTYFYTPDGISGVWYDTEDELNEAHGDIYTVISVHEILDY